MSGPSRRNSSPEGSRRTTACGFPTETGVSSRRSPSTSSASGRLTSTGPRSTSHVVAVDTRAGTTRSPSVDRGNATPLRAGEPQRGDAGAVSGELGLRPVRVPDHDVGLGTANVGDLEHAVRADAVMRVAEAAHVVRRQRAAELGPLDEQVGVTERVPLRESHPPPRSQAGRRRS